MNILQGEIWWISLEENPVGHEQGGSRPFFILSKSEYNNRSKTPIGFAVSKSMHKSRNKFSVEIVYKNIKNEDEKVWVNVSQLRTLSIERFGKKLGRCSSANDIQKIMNHFYKQIIL